MVSKPILVVDDEPIVRESIRDWLKDAGYQVETAETGEEAGNDRETGLQRYDSGREIDWKNRD